MGFSYNDVAGVVKPDENSDVPIRPVVTRPSAEAKPKGFSYEQLNENYVPPSERGVLTNAPDDDWLSSTGKYLTTAIAKGASHLSPPHALGDLASLPDMAIAYAKSKYKGISFEDAQQELNNEKVANLKMLQEKDPLAYAYAGGMSSLPTGADLQKQVFSKTGEYKPHGLLPELGMAGLEAGVSGLSPTGKAKAGEKAVELAKQFIPAFVGGGASQYVAKETGDPLLAMATGVGSGGASTVAARRAEIGLRPKPISEQVAGRVLRETVENVPGATAKLDAARTTPYLPGFEPTVHGATRDPKLAALLEKLPESPEKTAANRQLLEEGADEASRRMGVDVQGTYGLGSTTSPRQTASTNVRDTFSKLEEAASNNVENLWNNPSLGGTNMYKNRALSAIDSYINGLTTVRKGMIPKEISDTIEGIRSIPGRDVPIAEIQDLRSRVLAESRKAFRTGDNFTGGQLSDFGKNLANVIEDDKNIVFGDKTGKARAAWKSAVDATRDYHQTFNTGFLQDLNKETSAGVPKIAIDTTIDKMLSSKSGTQSLEQMQKATNGAINDHVADYMVANLTKDGTKLVKPQDVDAWLASGNNSAVVDKVPGLRQRLDNIKGASANQLLADGFSKTIGDPDKLVKFFDNNRSEINSAVSAADKPYMEMLENSARAMQKVPVDKTADLSAFNKIATGKTSDLVYGLATGRIMKSVGAYFAAKGLEYGGPEVFHHMGLTGELLAGLLGSQVGDVHSFGVNIPIGSMLERGLTGKVQQHAMEILQQAKRDPALMKTLMEKPDPKTLTQLFGLNTPRVIGTQTTEGIEQNREGRATGGAVNEYQAEADRWIREAEKAKDFLGKQTEVILDQPDNVVVAALNKVKNII